MTLWGSMTSLTGVTCVPLPFTYFVLFRDLVFEIALSVFECLRVYPSNCL